MGVAREQRYARLNRERSDEETNRPKQVSPHYLSHILISNERFREQNIKLKSENDHLIASLVKAKRLIRCLTASRSMERERAQAENLLKKGNDQFKNRLNNLASQRIQRLEHCNTHLMKVIKYAMTPEEYHRICTVLELSPHN